MKLTALSILLFFLLSISLNGQPLHLQYTKQQIKEDLSFMKYWLIQYHPNAQHPDFAEEFDAHFLNLPTKDTVSSFEAFQLFSSIMPIIKDGHTQLTVPPKSWKPCYYEGSYFPLEVYWDGTNLYLVKNLIDFIEQEDDLEYHSPAIPLGSKLLSINGIPSKDLLEEMRLGLMRDNNNLNYPTWVLNQYFYEYFSDMYGCQEVYQITYEHNGEIIRASVSGIPSFYFDQEDAKNQHPKGIHLSFEEQYATLSLRSWHDRIVRKEYHQKLKTELVNAFEQIVDSNVPNLIIDLRDNQGGNMNHSILALSYLLDQPFEIIKTIKRIKKGVLTEIETKQTGLHTPNEKEFTGKLFVLINGGSFSNTSIFCTALKKYNRATFIGSETGGSSYTFCYGPSNYKLKHTRITIKIPSNQAVLQSDNQVRHGVLPDYEISPTIEGILEKRDEMMEFTTDLIQNQPIEK